MIHILSNINLFFIMYFAFFGYTSESELFFLVPISILSIILIGMTGKVRVSKSDIPFIAIIIFFALTYFYSFSKANTLIYIFKVFLLLVMYLAVRQTIKAEQIIKYTLVFSSIHILFSYLYLVIPDLIISISENILVPESFYTVQSLYRRGAIAGITDQTGTNAFYISVFITIFFNKFFSEKKKLYSFIFLVLAFIMLLFTQKRGLLLANIVAILLLYLSRSVKKLNLRKIFYLSVLMVILFGIVKTPLVQELINNIIIKNDNDILGGRSDLLEGTLSIGIRNWFFGTGINTIPSRLGFTTHNVYVQLFAEVGILGLFIYITFIMNNLINSIANVKLSNTFLKNTSFYFQLIFIIYSATGNPIYDFKFFTIYMLFVIVGFNDIYYLKEKTKIPINLKLEEEKNE